MTTKDIFTALNYPAGVARIGNGPKLRDAQQFIAAKYPQNTFLLVTTENISIVSKEEYKQKKREKTTIGGDFVVVDTEEGWDTLSWF